MKTVPYRAPGVESWVSERTCHGRPGVCRRTTRALPDLGVGTSKDERALKVPVGSSSCDSVLTFCISVVVFSVCAQLWLVCLH